MRMESNIEERISAAAESDIPIGLLVYWIDTYNDGNYKSLTFNLIDTQKSKKREYVGGFHLFRNKEALGPRGHSRRHVLTESIAPAISTPGEALPKCLAHAIPQSGKWYNECLGEHEECRQESSIEDFWRPRRLLRLTASGDCSVIRSKDDGVAQNGAPYATLSYCWGQAEFIKLTAANATMLEAGIRIVDLPKTFQEAITICRSLGIDYLWIDCLCILQDSLEDWQQEASQMGAIYAGSALNIAAADATSPLESSLNLSPLQARSTPIVWLNARNGTAKSPYKLYPRGIMDHEFSSAPIMRRGWITQELLLAPRILYLFRHQLWWECNRLFASETYNNGIPLELLDTQSQFPRNRIIVHQPSEKAIRSKSKRKLRKTRQRLLKLWYDTIMTYTACDLTFATDKLVAISGVAKRFEYLLDDVYLAGHWKRTMIKELCWEYPMSAQPRRRPTSYRAPSWSWASVDGKRIWKKSSHPEQKSAETIFTKMIECILEYATADRTGQVLGGYLRLCGPLLSIKLVPGGAGPQGSVRGEVDGIIFLFMAKDFDLGVPGSNMHLMPISRAGDKDEVQCLVLEPTGEARGQFRRIGVWTDWLTPSSSPMSRKSGGRLRVADDQEEDQAEKYEVARFGRSAMSHILDSTQHKNHDWFEFESFDGQNYTISII